MNYSNNPFNASETINKISKLRKEFKSRINKNINTESNIKITFNNKNELD